MDQLLENLVQKLADEGQITIEAGRAIRRRRRRARATAETAKVTFEVTDKSLDFLGFKTLEGSARVAGQIELRAARYARSGDRASNRPARRSSTNSAIR